MSIMQTPCFVGRWGLVLTAAATAVTAQEKPGSAATKLLAAQTSRTEITLVWQLDPRATEYVVYGPRKKADLGGAGVRLGTVSGGGTRYVARVLAPGAEHHYTLETVPRSGSSKRFDFNVVVPKAPGGTGTIAAPTGVVAELTSPGVVTVRWNPIDGASAYAVGRSVRPNGFRPLCDLCDPRRAKYVDRETVAGQVHLYSVATVTPDGRSRVTRSNEVTPTGSAGPVQLATEDSTPPADFTATDSSVAADSKGAIDLKAGLKSGNTVLLTWNGLLSGHRYQIRRTIEGALSSVIATITGTMSQYLDQLPSGIGGRVSYLIEELNGKGASPQVVIALNTQLFDSAKARTYSASALSKGPSNLRATVISPGTIRLDWNLLAPVAGQMMPYIRIYRRLENGALVLIGSVNPGLASFIDHLQGNFMGVTYAIEAVYEKGPSQRATVSIDPRKDLVAGAGGVGDTTGGKGAVANPLPKGPSDVNAVMSGPNTVTLTWIPLPDATYEIRRSIGTALGQVIATIASEAGRYVDQLPPLSSTKDNTVLYRISVANNKLAVPVVVSIDPVQGTSETIEDPGLDSLRSPGGRLRVP